MNLTTHLHQQTDTIRIFKNLALGLKEDTITRNIIIIILKNQYYSLLKKNLNFLSKRLS